MPATDCIFCKIANKELASDIVYENKELASDIVYEDEQAVAFRDINPQAPVHVLVIPRKHIAGIKSATADDEAIVGHCVLLARSIAQQEGLAERGYYSAAVSLGGRPASGRGRRTRPGRRRRNSHLRHGRSPVRLQPACRIDRPASCGQTQCLADAGAGTRDAKMDASPFL